MSVEGPVLHMVCGKAGAGKSTLCARLAGPGIIVVVQDDWMSRLYREELQSVEDYVRLVPRLRGAMGPHLTAVLRAGLSVVMDWPANTVAVRRWMRGIAEAAGARHRLHYLDVPDAVCLARLAVRNASGAHAYRVSPEEFETLTSYFEPPTESEGLDVQVPDPRAT